MQLNELLQEFVNLSYEDILAIARERLGELLPVFNQAAKDGDGAKFALLLMGTSLAVDGKLTEKEYNFVNDLLGNKFTYDETKQMVELHYNADFLELADQVVDSCSGALKASLLTFCTCFLAVDETISRDEVAFIKKLLA